MIRKARAHSAHSALWRVSRELPRWTAYYTDSLEDAVKTARLRWARTRDVVQAVYETVATERVPGCIVDTPLKPKATRPEVEE